MARHAGTSDRLVISLSGVGNTRGVMPPFEMARMATDNGRHSAIFVSDKTRSWMNAPNLADLILAQIDIAQKMFRPAKVSAVGNSMGGFMALELSRHVDLKTTLAVVPQYSAMQSEVPEEKRWAFFRNKIESFQFPRVENLPTEGCTHYVIHGGEEDEFIHWSRFPVQSNLKHMILPEEGHNLAQYLKAKGKLKDIVQFAIENRYPAFRQLIERMGGKPRADLRLSDFSNLSTEAML